MIRHLAIAATGTTIALLGAGTAYAAGPAAPHHGAAVRPPTAYVADVNPIEPGNSFVVTPVNTLTSTAGKKIKTGGQNP